MPEQVLSDEKQQAEKPFPWRCPKCRQPAVTRVTMPYRCQRTHDGSVVTVEVPNLAVPRCSNCGEVVFDYAADEQIRTASQTQFGPAEIATSEKQKHGSERPARSKMKFGTLLERPMSIPRITPEDIRKARQAYAANEPRDLFYRAATELVALAQKCATSLTVAEALAVLLQTWNRSYYRYRTFDKEHFDHLESLLKKHQDTLAKYRNQAIEDLDNREGRTITDLFQAFENVLGPVGAAKALHLLAPRLFPLWDRSIAKAYKLPLRKAGSNGERYWQFLLSAQEQCHQLKNADPNCPHALKSIDEYNYCKYSKGWLP